MFENGVPQGSVLTSLLINIYTHDLPTTSRRFAYADDLSILRAVSKWQTLEGTLYQNMETLSTYLQKWKLKLPLYSNEARRKLNIAVNGRTHRRGK